MSGADPMGICQLNLNQHGNTGEEVNIWLDVMGCKGCKDATGKIHVSFLWAAELSAEDRKRRAEEARARLYDKAPEPVRAFTMEEALAAADEDMEIMSKLRFGKYLEKEMGEEKLKEWRNEESELEKTLDRFDDVKDAMEEERLLARLAMTVEEENKTYLELRDREDEDEDEGLYSDGFSSPKSSRPSSRGSEVGNFDTPSSLKITFSPDKIRGDPFVKLKGQEKTEMARQASFRRKSMQLVKNQEEEEEEEEGGGDALAVLKERANFSGGTTSLSSRSASIMLKMGGSAPIGKGALAMLGGGGGGGAPSGGGVATGSGSSAAKAALGSMFSKKSFDASKFMGAAAEGESGGSGERARTPTVIVSKMVTSRVEHSRSDSDFSDSKQEYEKMVKGLELRLKKRGRSCVTVRTVQKVVPKNANHAFNILNAAARDEPIK